MVLFFLCFLLMLLLGAPIGFALCIPSFFYFIANNIPLSVFVQKLVQSLNSFPILAIPLFIMAGRFMNEGGITKRIFHFANNAIGFIPGGLGHVNVLSSMIFAGMSGAAVADLGGLGQIEVEAMNEAKYPIHFTAGITAASSIIGPIIPPSISIVVFSVVSDASVLALFAGGIIPGIFIGIVLMITVYIYSKKINIPRNDFPRLKELFFSFLNAFPALMAPVILIGGMLSGIFTPTEAAGVTVLYSLILSLFIYRDLSLGEIPHILIELLSQISKLAFLIASAVIFAWVLTIEQVPQYLLSYLVIFTYNKSILLIIICLFYLFMGCFLMPSIVFLITTPLLIPIIRTAGISDIHFGILSVFAMQLGLFTPPVGVAIYLIQDLCNLSFKNTMKALFPFVIALLVALIILIFIPDLVTFLPTKLGIIK